MQIVWFKRDLRVRDHRALSQAAAHGDVLPLYVVEPELWAQSDMSGRHWAFIEESLRELRDELGRLGQPLVVRCGEITDVLQDLAAVFAVSALRSHEETGNAWTYQRDKRVAAWCRGNGIAWHEVRNHGVQRRLASRDGWAKSWDQFMAESIVEAPDLKPVSQTPDRQ